MSARAWFLNFDADDELADPSARTPSRASRDRARALAAEPSVRALLAPGDVIVPDSSPDLVDRSGLEGRAWCPTPRALAALARFGATLPDAPSPAILRRVNHRRFSFDLGRALPRVRWARTRAEVLTALADPSPTGLWLMRRPFGFAGRGKLRVDPARRDAAIDRWIDASLARGDGLEIAPWVERLADFGLHGHLSREGALVLGEPTVQRCDDAGVWMESARATPGEIEAIERDALTDAARESARALLLAGYHGPFGVDAFRYRDERGEPRFEPRCEINARYSMGWSVGMGDRRPDLARRA